MVTRTGARTHEARRTARRLLEYDVTTLVVAGLVTTLVWLAIFHEPGRVDIEVTNPTGYDIAIEVQSRPGEGWMPIGTIPRESKRGLAELFDLGSHWTFRFSAQGIRAGTADFSRSDLEAAQWKLDIPPAIDRLLHDRGVPLSPLSTAARPEL